MPITYTDQVGALTSELNLELNKPEHKQRVLAYHKSGHLQHGIAQLNIESGDRLIILLSALKRNWDYATALILDKTSRLKPANGQIDAKEDSMIADVANMLIIMVSKYKSDHPHEVANERAHQRHLSTATATFVEIFYDAFTNPGGAFSTAFLSSHLRNKIAQTTFKNKSSEGPQKELGDLKVKYEALLKERDDRVSALLAERSAVSQLRQEVSALKVLTNRLESQNRILSGQIVHAEDMAAASDARATRAEDETLKAERKAMEYHDSIANFLTLTKDAKQLAKRSKLRAVELQGLYFTALENQWEAAGRMPRELWAQIQPYNTLLQEDSGFDPFFARIDTSDEF